ncbi:hypothetical protein ASG56_11295 [Rhodococcus sp. Leaf7]|uniref:non-ribosomal peptide synthetase n=1 Tax=unclassified Rhodococcus (in: high G+C Gram-positive bacteria) TaxID=192944 RepID=UPI0006FED6FD|nr:MULTISPECIES: non-ribosomal peptide synthetase [unclassified Rhodococcus (in: high G+C Gram-positive bacteria)]KQU04004.1 hypothetical protein ASG56_11295 [Rhodococcus sp. Leaf7]KQU40188.1 hypothetical protein ASG64_11290 [Rhodococcus sp. Leaf247]
MGDDRNEGAVVSLEGLQVPLTGAQRPLWLAQHLDPDAAFTIALHVDIDGPIDHARLERAMHAAGTESGLRQTRITGATDDEPTLTFVDDAVMNLDTVDLRDELDPTTAARDWMQNEFQRPVDLYGTTLVQCAFVRVADDHTYLYLRAHHLVLDGQGAFTLLTRIAGHYSDSLADGFGPTPDAALRIHDSEVAYRESRRHDTDLAHWSDHLADFTGPTSMSTNPPSAPRQPRATRVPWAPPAGTVSDPLAVVAALAVHQSRVLDTADVMLGFPVTGRTTAALRATAGMMANLVPLRLRVDDDTAVRDLVARVRQEITGALRHQRFREWDRIVDAEARPYGVSFGPVVNIMPFVAPLTFDDVVAPVTILSSGPVHDTAVTIYPGDALTFDIQWNPERYDDSDIERHGTRLTRLLDGILRADDDTTVGNLPFFGDGEEVDLLSRTGGPAPSLSTLGDLLAQVVGRRPDALALREKSTTLTYAELDVASSLLARTLADRGAGPGTVVALALPRSTEYLVALWAVVRTGAAFLPVDPAAPSERLDRILTDSAVLLGVTSRDHVADLPIGVQWTTAADAASEPLPWIRPAISDLAYVLYTSGSTGRPKGVAVTHHGVHGVVAAHRARADDAAARVLAVAAPTFDASISEMLLAVALSACLVVADDRSYAGAPLQDLLHDEKVTHAILTPRVLGTLDTDGLESLRCVLSVGDVLPPTLAARWARGRHLYDDYGPTEATIWATGTGCLGAEDRVTIGRPLPGVGAAVLDSRLRPVPIGVPGELHLSGPGLARGYVGRPAETAVRFVAGPDGSRRYRTGDRARWTRGGDLDHLGRTDAQVKLRGQRIEPGEIDTALRGAPGVVDAATIVRRDGESEQLVSYVTGDADPAAVLAVVARMLPSYLVPAHIVPVAALPLTASGKLDVAALPEPDRRSRTSSAPGSDIEHALVTAVSQVLARTDIGVDDDFFALGGDSILSIRLVSVAAAAGVRVSARDVFEQRTVAALARVADRMSQSVESPDDGVGPVVPTPIVRHLLGRGGSLNRFAQTLTVALPVGIDRQSLVDTVTAVVDHHDMLRAVLVRDTDGAHLDVRPRGAVDVDALIRHVTDEADVVDDVVRELDPETGTALALVWSDSGPQVSGRLVIVAHHLVIDVVSWGIVIADLVATWAGRGEASATLDPVRTSMRRWATGLMSHDATDRLPYWRSVLQGPDPVLGQRRVDPVDDTVGDATVRDLTFTREITDAVMTRAPHLFHAGPTDALLASLALAVAVWRSSTTDTGLLLQLEGHGREDHLVPGADTARTVGWFTTVFPVRLDLTGLDFDDAMAGGSAAGEAILRVKEHLAAVPDHGASYGLLRYPADGVADESLHWTPQLSFAHLGRMSTAETGDWLPVPDVSPFAGPRAEDLGAAAALEIDTVVVDGVLVGQVSHLPDAVSTEDVTALLDLWVSAATAIARHLDDPRAGGHSPSDFPLVRASGADVDSWTARHPTLTDVLPTAPLQSGLLFHAQLADTTVDPYVVQTILRVRGTLDSSRLRRAAQALLDRHDGLRVAFAATSDGTDVQVVVGGVSVPWTDLDVAGDPDPGAVIDAFLAHDRTVGFDVAAVPLMRFALLHSMSDEYTVVLTHHHLILDGWSLPIVLGDLLTSYAGDTRTPESSSLRRYLQWLGDRDTAASVTAWTQALAGQEEPTLLAPAISEHAAAVPGQRITTLDPDRTAAVVARATDMGVTTNTFVQFAWGVVLGSVLGRTDVVFGATVSGRPPELPGSASMVGLLITTVPVLVRLEPSTSLRECVALLQKEQAALMDHHHLGPATIEAAVGAGARFDTSLAFESYPVDHAALTALAGDLTVLGVEARDATHYPLSIAVEIGDELILRATHRTDAVDGTAVDRMMDRVVRVLTAADVDRPVGEIDLLSPDERRIISGWNTKDHTVPPSTLIDPWEDHDGSRIAFSHGDTRVSRGDFAGRVHRLARYLVSHGAGPEVAVAVAVERSIDLFVAVHAVVATGAHYVPIDADHPVDRLRHALRESGALFGLVTGSTPLPDVIPWIDIADVPTAGLSAEPLTDAERLSPLRPDHLAYVLFTSGSTGLPKGVGVSHAAIVSHLQWRAEFVGLTADDVVLNKTPATFDVSLWELFLPWHVGAEVVVADPGAHGDADAMVELIARRSVSVVHFVPSMLALVADAPGLAACTSLRTILSSGESLLASVADSVRAALPVTLVNLYGPTEAAVDVTAHVVTDDDTTEVPIGRPVWNTTTLVLDAALRPVPIDVVGELYLGGDQLARGYANRRALTAERFVAAPGGRRLYRTGDRVRWTASGELVFVGRTDDQLSVRGVRIEPAEIEHVLTALPEVDRAVVTARGDRLVAHIVAAQSFSDIAASARYALRSALPRHLVPDDVVEIGALPLTASGKVDRRLLGARTLPGHARTHRLPSTPTQRLVADVFDAVLQPDGPVGADDDFFGLGGTSLTAARAVARIRSTTGRELSLRTLFDVSTVAGLAALLDSAAPDASVVRIGGERPATLPLSFAQQRMWFLDRYEPGSYVMPLALRMRGDLDTSALTAALDDLVARHEILRTVYADHDGTVEQIVLPPASRREPPVTTIDLDDLPDRLESARFATFDLATEPSLRAEILRIDDADHVLLLLLHHIAADGVSLTPLARDLLSAYDAHRSGRASTRSPLPVQYADVAVHQRRTGVDEQATTWWADRLASLPDVLDMPTDRPRSEQPTRISGRVSLDIDVATVSSLADLAARHRGTVFMVVHTALAVALSRWTGSRDIAVGTPVSGRPDPILDDLVGLFVDTVVLRTAIDPAESFAQVLARTRDETLDAFVHAAVPFDHVVDILGTTRTSAHHPVFQVMAAFQDEDPVRGRSDIEVLDVGPAPATFDLTLDVRPRAGGLACVLTYARDLFDHATAQRFCDILQRVLTSVVTDSDIPVGDLEIRDPKESGPATHPLARCEPLTLPQLLDRAPDGIAIVDGDTELTRAEWAQASNRWARHLISLGVGPDTVVAVALTRSAQYLTMIAAISRAGGAFLPIDPGQPTDRLEQILTESAAAVLVVWTSDSLSDIGCDATRVVLDDPATVDDVTTSSDEAITDEHRLARLNPDHLAYVIYTSGSTGRPKGVALSHRGLRNAVEDQRSRHESVADARVLAVSSTTFDASVGELLIALAMDAALVVAPDGVFGGAELNALMRRHRVTHTLMTPRALDVTTDAGLEHLGVVMSAGEACPPSLVEAWAPDRRMSNVYGPTEATVWSTSATLEPGRPVTIGTATLGVDAIIRDSRLHAVPSGVVGELYLAGEQLARGYLGRPALTASRFVAAPGGARTYRTGDLVRLNAAGDIVYLGRDDHQVTLRGLRIELGEIESALNAAPGVGTAVAAVHEERIVAWVSAADGRSADAVDMAEVTAAATRALPRYMVPTVVTAVDAMPLTTSGKLDRARLPRPSVTVAAFRAPTSPLEIEVASVFATVLDREDPVGLDDDFFVLGGQSLSATRVAARLDTSVRTIFDAPTVAALATRLTTEPSPPTRSTFRRPTVRPDVLPLSFAQQRMWFLNTVTPDSGYVIPLALRLRGLLDHDALAGALADVVERHEILRTVYPAPDGVPRQRVLQAGEVTVPFEHVVDEPSADVLERIASAPFDLATELPIRAAVVSVAEDDHVLAICLHHIAADGWSLAPLTRDITAFYGARRSGLPAALEALPAQYADHAVWQHDHAIEIRERSSYWTDRLAGLADVLPLPTDRPRPLIATHRGARVPITIPDDTVAALRSLATAQRATVFMVVQAAWAITLSRITGRDDIVVGTPVAGRGQEDLDQLVGMFVDTVVLRSTVTPGATFAALLDDVRESTLSAFAHGDVPFELIVDALDPVRSTSHHPLVQVMFAFQNQPPPTLTAAGLEIGVLDPGHVSAAVDLTLDLTDGERGLHGALTYAVDLFDHRTAARIGDILLRVLDGVARRPFERIGALEILHPSERALLLSQHGSAGLPPRVLPRLLADAVAGNPTGPAVIADRTLTYDELDRRSNRWARVLVGAGAGPGSVVALALPRSLDQITAVWSVAKTGAAFLPVDPSGPAERLSHIVTEVGVLLAVTAGGPLADLHSVSVDSLDDAVTSEAAVTADDRLGAIHPDTLAYVIHTSGSTGVPKGVGVTHRGLVDALWDQRLRGVGDARVLAVASPTFDASIAELLIALSLSAPLVVAPPDVFGGPALERLVADSAVTHALITPRVLESMTPEHVPGLRSLVTAGEACPPALVARWAPGRRFFNDYGPTETTIWATSQGPLRPDDAVTIGRPVRGVGAHVLDTFLRPVPIGIPGELYLEGAHLARGYVGRPASTAERFVASSHGTRLYRTGDRVRWTSTGELDYLGRNDFQVKLRGLRIELGEIDAAVTAHPGVERAVVLVQDDHLVAYVVGTDVEADRLRQAVARTLPRYMVPTHVVVLDEFPLTSSGKLDRRALPEVSVTSAPHRPAVTSEQRLVAEAFAAVLDLTESPGLDDNFFDLGGHSLTATRVAAHVSVAAAREVSVRSVFDHPTVAALAGNLTESPASVRPALTTAPRPDRVPLSFAQHRMWFLNRIDADRGGYVVPIALALTGRLDVEALQSALGDVIDRHEILRTVHPAIDGVPHQVVLPSVDVPLSVVTVDADAVPDAVRDAIAVHIDVVTDTPLRATLLVISPTEHVLVLVVHHIAADGWSMAPLTRDVVTAYGARARGRRPDLSPLPVQYADHAVRQRATLGSPEDPSSPVSRHLAYWLDRLAGLPLDLALPTDHPRPRTPSHQGDRVHAVIDRDAMTALAAAARAHDVTLFMLAQTALSLVLAQWAGTDDLAIGTAVAGRDDPALDETVGMFVDTVVLRTTVDSERSVADHLAAARETTLDAFAHAALPFDLLVSALDPVRTTASHPVVQVMLTLQNVTPPTFPTTAPTVEVLDLGGTSVQFDLSMTLTEDDGRLLVDLTYATELFERSTVERVVRRFVHTLGSMSRDTSVSVRDLDTVEPSERIDMSTRVGAPALPPRTLDRIIADARVARPDAVAVRTDDVDVTYAEMGSRAHRLARELIACGVGPDAVVALALPRSIDHLVSVWAVAAAGAAFLSVDTSHPTERIAHVLRDSDAVIVVTTADRAGPLGPAAPWIPRLVLDEPDVVAALSRHRDDDVVDTERRATLQPTSAAYVIYTSGSTGRPKGVTVTYAGLADAVEDQRRRSVPGAARVLAVASPTFDASIAEMLMALAHVATLVLAPPTVHGGTELSALIRRQRVTHAIITPRVLESLSPAGLDCVGVLVVGGEALPDSVAATWSVGREMYNDYGPTETTIWASAHGPISSDRPVGIGAPVRGVGAVVLDAHLRPVPLGSVGELYLTGSHLARGYVGQPALTAARFVPAPFAGPGERMYRTGDLVRWNSSGELSFLGRTDFQIKLRGLRIEPGEIENAALAHPGVTQAVVIAHRDAGTGAEHLVAYVSGDALDVTAVRDVVADRVPQYMVPTRIVAMSELPRTTSGKLDRAALPTPTFAPTAYRAPSTPTEHMVADAFAIVLGLGLVGRDDDFFALGGTSLSATRVAAHLGRATGVDRVLRLLFTHGTVVAIAEHLDREDDDESLASSEAVAPVMRLGGGDGLAPVFCIHPMMGLAWPYFELGRHLEPTRPLWGVQTPAVADPNFAPATMAEVVDRYVAEIRRVDPDGPYHLVGWSVGGVLAHAVAARMESSGLPVASLTLLDPVHSVVAGSDVKKAQADAMFGAYQHLTEDLADMTPDALWAVWSAMGGDQLPVSDIQARLITKAMLTLFALVDDHVPESFGGEVLMIDSDVTADQLGRMSEFWARYCTGPMTVESVPWRHGELLSSEAVADLGPLVSRWLPYRDRVPHSDVAGAMVTVDE